MHPGADGVVRVVDLKTQKAMYQRAVNRLVPLLLESASLAREDVQA